MLRKIQCHNRADKIRSSHFVGPKFESRPFDWTAEKNILHRQKMLQPLTFPNKFLPNPNSQSAHYHSQLCNPRHWLKWVWTSDDSAENKSWLYRTYILSTCCTFNGPHSGRPLLTTGTPFSRKFHPNHRSSLTSNLSVTLTYLSACNSWPTVCSKTTSTSFPGAGIRGRRNCDEKRPSWVD